jgi:murein DD-endopeptidase MepM/ murein hydrolase activator NlpD
LRHAGTLVEQAGAAGDWGAAVVALNEALRLGRQAGESLERVSRQHDRALSDIAAVRQCVLALQRQAGSPAFSSPQWADSAGDGEDTVAPSPVAGRGRRLVRSASLAVALIGAVWAGASPETPGAIALNAEGSLTSAVTRLSAEAHRFAASTAPAMPPVRSRHRAGAWATWPPSASPPQWPLSAAFGSARVESDVLEYRPAAYRPSPGYVWPAQGVTVPGGEFGAPRDWMGYTWHTGLDLAGAEGSPIVAAAWGIVTHAGWEDDYYGNSVIIDHGNGLRTRYGHLLDWSVAAGRVVTQGQVIGRMGSTGNSHGPHLHFEVAQDGRYVDPTTVLP